ncbi:probable carboxylesterase 2 [Typha angustifolia]|uniref:probable carboxylesterase 2 n=1 Tax=Typha angustifolia TaxID=59011 RepID=UPI003C30AAD5
MEKPSRAVVLLAKRSLPVVLFFSLLYVFLKRSMPASPALPLVQRPPPVRSKSPAPPHHSPPPFNKELDNQIEYEFIPFLRLYKSGRVERFYGTTVVPPGDDPYTGVVSKDVVIDPETGLSARLYLPKEVMTETEKKGAKLPVLLYFHGGAFVIESAFSPSYHAYLNLLVSKAKIVAVSVNYRLAPEHPLPVAYDDSWVALKWVSSNCRSGPDPWLAGHGDTGHIFLAGDSAGGNIAHNLAVRAGRDGLERETRIKGLALLNPYFWGKDPVGSEPKERWIREELERSWRFVCGGSMGIEHPSVDPTAAVELWRKVACERVMVTVAGRDFFRERGVAYADGLRRSGWKGEVELYETAGEVHVYFLSNLGSEKAAKEMEAVVMFLNRDRVGFA